jgi:glycosyltransferase involved in cell wall biosynthesis
MTRRILLVGCDIPGWGGAATWQYQLLERMQQDGAEVTSVSLMQEMEEAFFRYSRGDDFANPRALANVHVCRLEGDFWRRHERLVALVESLAPDLVVCFGVIATVLVRLAAPRVPVVFMTIGSYEVQRLIECGAVKDFMHFERLASRGVDFHVHRTSREREAVEVADLIVVHSPVVRFAFAHAYPLSVGKTFANLVSVADLIYPEAARFADLRRPFQERDIDAIFIASGWGRQIKNFPLVGKIAARNRGLNIHIVGECDLRLSSCTHHGAITRREDLYRLLGRSRTIVCPSLLDAAPGVLFEASGMGCNVIASRNCGNWDLCHAELAATTCSPAEFDRTIRASLAGAYPDHRERFRGGYRELADVLSVV